MSKPHRLNNVGAPLRGPDTRPFWLIGGGRPLPDVLDTGPSSIHGTGIFARDDIPAQTCLGPMAVPYSTQLVRVGSLGAYLNHSDDPNCKRETDFTTGWEQLWTLRKIRFGEELTIRYAAKLDDPMPVMPLSRWQRILRWFREA